MNKVYLVHLEFTNGWEQETETRVAQTHEKAKEFLKDWAEKEIEQSWIGDYEESEFDYYYFGNIYFDAQYGELRTTIWIEEKEIE